ncbi:MAG: phosphatidate cytidylyltransferase [Acetobacteraceae bacterium]
MAHDLAERPQRWTDLRTRVLSAAVLAPVVLGCLWVGGTAFVVLVLLAAAGLSFEWLTICDCRPGTPAAAPFLAAVMGAALSVVFGAAVLALPILAAGAVLTWLLAPVATRSWFAIGVLYLGLGVAALLWLRDDGAVGRAHVLFILILVWASDIGAYMVGRTVGGARLAPRISPGKTWSGAVGGLLVAVTAATVASYVMQPPSSLVMVMLAAAGLGIVAQVGDLFESLAKRHFGVKDSGHIIPGHGGLLDRLDALLAAAPVAAAFALVSGRGVVFWA